MEVWLKAKGFPAYEVSSDGQVRNTKTGRILKQNLNDKGYPVLTLRRDGQQIPQRIHRLVADTFYDGDHNGYDVNHIDGNKENNHVSNLEFCTRRENVQHAFQMGLKKPSRQMKVRVVETGEVYDSIRECGRVLNLNQSDICKCLNGGQITCGGYHYERVK